MYTRLYNYTMYSDIQTIYITDMTKLTDQHVVGLIDFPRTHESPIEFDISPAN
jgi:hypothetical protein